MRQVLRPGASVSYEGASGRKQRPPSQVFCLPFSLSLSQNITPLSAINALATNMGHLGLLLLLHIQSPILWP